MDRYRGGDRYGNSPNDSQHSRHPRGGGGGGGGPPPSRPSDDSLINRHRGGFSGNIHPFDNSPPRYSLTGGGGGGGGFHPMDGDGGFRPLGVRGGRNFNPSSEFEVPLSGPRFNPEYEVPLSGQKRRYDFPGRGGSSPDRFGGGGFEKRNFDGDNYDKRHVNGGNFDRKQFDGGNIAKLFVGSVPKTATEDDIRPPFEEYGNVLEVALIKDKRGQQQGNSVFASAGCCFIKYATSEEADRAIRALHNQYILPGGVGPIQVRYADGERERLGAVEYKLFIGSLNKQAIEKEVEEIFLPYGRVEDVYLMRDELKQSRGCGFVKYSNREAAMAAIDALNGIYRMRGCEQPLIVRFADPKRPRPGETRGSPGFGGPGFAPRLPSPGVRPPNQGEMMQAPFPQNAWHPMNQQQGMHGKQSSAPNFNPSFDKPNQSPQQFSSSNAPPSSTVRPPAPGQSQGQGQVQGQSQGQGQNQGQGQGQNQGQLQALNSGGQASFSQGFQSQPMLGYNGMLPIQQAQAQTQTQTQPQAQGVVSSTTQPALSNNMPPHVLNAMMNQYQLPGQQQQMMQQSASPMAQMLSQQKQTLQASYQSSQQAFSQLQQQLQLMQPTNPTTPQQNLQGPRLQQSTWAGSVQQTQATSGGPTAKPVTDSHPASSVASVMLPAGGLVKCNWTEHTSPDGYKYYYNSTTGESKWEKPEELTLFEQQQQQKPQEQQQPKQQQQQGGSIQPSHGQTNIQSLPSQQTQIPQIQLQSHLQTQMQPQGRHPQQLQPATQSSTYQNMQGYGYAQMPVAGGYMNDPARFPQGMQQQQGGQEWMWKNKATGPGS